MDQQQKERINKWDYMKLKDFCTTKEEVSELKMPSTEWERIFFLETPNKELITRIFRVQKSKLPQEINYPKKKRANELNRAFSKEEVQMAKKLMENI
jgi:hypothetical protein